MKQPLIYRTALFERSAINEADRTVELSISSDEPILGERGMEILDHSAESIDLSRMQNGSPLLFNHDKNQHIGRIVEVNSDGHRLRVRARISRTGLGAEKWEDIKDGILKEASVGCAVDWSNSVVEGKTRDGTPIIRAKRWLPAEGSLCTIPADLSVGIGRSASSISHLSTPISAEVDTLAAVTRESNLMPEPTLVPPAPAAPVIDVKEVESKAVKNERKRSGDIRELENHFRTVGFAGHKIDTRELADQYDREGKSADEFQRAVALGNFKAPVEVNTDGKIGAGEKDLSKYSIVRGIYRQAIGKFDGLEKEMSDAHYKKTGQEPAERGFGVPQDVLEYGGRRDLQRTLTALGAGVYASAGALVADDFLGGSMIELLRHKMALVRMGARILSGCQGNVQIPLQSGGATASWLAEDATQSATSQTVGQLNLTPHRLGATTAYTYNLLAQSSIDIENFVRQDLMAVIALAKDLAGIAGSGASGQPLGILNTSNLSTSVTFANAQTMLYSDALIFENNLAVNDADQGKLGYLVTPTVRKNAKATAEISAANANPIWKNNEVNGYPAFATNQVPTATSVIFGNWDDAVIADWAGQTVIVDPYSLSLAGQVRVVIQQLTDFGLRHSKSFSVSTN